jgi:hypothetical protein
MTDAVETGSDVALQDPLRGMLSGQHIEALFDRICSGALRPEAIGVGVAERFSDWIQREYSACIARSAIVGIDKGRWRPVPSVLGM